MGCPVSPIVANLYVEDFEKKAFHTASTPKCWFRFVDDTFVIQQEAHKELFMDYINSLDPAFKFTVEDNQENGSIPLLDTLVKPEADNSLSISVYRKPTLLTSTCSWIVITIWLPSIVSLVLLPTGLK